MNVPRILLFVELVPASILMAVTSASAQTDTSSCPAEVRNHGDLDCTANVIRNALSRAEECVDMRKELCYMSYADSNCSNAMSQPQTRMVCCCSMGAAWGRACEECPKHGSRKLGFIDPLKLSSIYNSCSGEYLQLCGNRPGSIIDPMTGISKEIDECTLMPQMCQNGVCMNVPGSFKCECNRGYVYDEDAHQCIGKFFNQNKRESK